MSQLLMVEQRHDRRAVVPWVLDRDGSRMPGCDHERRCAEVGLGLMRHPQVWASEADAGDDEVERALKKLHEPSYLEALAEVRSSEPMLMPDLVQPGLAADTPVCADLIALAREGARTAISAAQRTAAGDRFAYALCAPPGHHAGPGWLGGLCYLNNAAVAAHTLSEGGVKALAILDLDLHYPNGTSAIVASMEHVSLHSLHAWPVVNAPSPSVRPRTPRERLVAFREPPDAATYTDALAASLEALAQSAEALVVSLGYDTVAGDPHGCWSFAPAIYTEIGRVLAASRLPVCIVQEGGYAVHRLALCSHAFAAGLLNGAPT
jgi:acetoin utilization deacetylase AcuC-like enzyme